MRACASRFLNLQTASLDLRHLLLADLGPTDSEDLVCYALLVYAAYRATNHYRIHGTCDTDTATEALAQHCKNAVQGHAGSRRILDSRWARETVPQHTSAQPKRRRLRSPGADPARARPHASAGEPSAVFVAGAALVTGDGWQG